MVAESVGSSRLGSAYGLIQAMDSAGAVLGPLAALLLLEHHGLRTVFWLAAVPGLFCVAVALLGIRETGTAGKEPAVSSAAARKNSTWRPKLPGVFYYVLAAVSLFSLGNSSDMFLVLRAQSVGIPVTHAPLLGLVFNIMYTLFSWPAGRLSDRFSRRAMAAGGYAVFAAVYFTFAAAPSVLAIWLAMACYGLFYALTNPVLKALVVETVAPEARGRALGIYFFTSSVAVLIASLITGELWKQYGARVPFFLSGGIALTAAGLLLASRWLRPSTRRA
jgi:MFS family permease